MMTNQEHDSLWMAAFSSIPNTANCVAVMANSLRRSNALTAIKELYELGEMSKELYIDTLTKILLSEGFEAK